MRFAYLCLPSAEIKGVHHHSTVYYLFIFDYRSSHLDFLSFRRPSEAVLLCMYGCFASLYVCIPHACLMPVEARRDNQIPRTAVTYRWVLSPTWVLGREHGSFGRVVSAFRHRAISPALIFILLFCNSGKRSAWYDWSSTYGHMILIFQVMQKIDSPCS